MNTGRPKLLPSVRPFKHKKEYHIPGCHYKRVENLLAKQQKLQTLKSLIVMYEAQDNLDIEYIRDLKRRANEIRSQLAVLSTTCWRERP